MSKTIVGSMPLPQLEARLKADVKDISFTSSDRMTYRIYSFVDLSALARFTLQMDLRATEAHIYQRRNVYEKDVVFFCHYDTLSELLDYHPLNIARFEINEN